MNMHGLYIAIFGVLIIIIQLLFPDPVPAAINNMLSQDTSQFIGFTFVLKAFLFLWVIIGYVLLIGGIVTMVISNRR
jgi:hypothetical protein